jgi:2-oxoglutarate dehydrogenase E2 component (dihydrolipoamide succinyltransferase)
MIELKVPALSESVTEGTLITWHKKEGEAVAAGENLIDLETDKVVLELPAPKAGVLSKIVRQNGEVVLPGEIIALIDETVQSVKEIAKAAILTPAIGPSARKLAAEHALDPASITGSARGGRVTLEDVQAKIAPDAEPGRVSLPLETSGNRVVQRVPMTRLRARIAERLVEAQRNAAILTTFNEVNMQPVMDLRSRYKDKFEKEHGVKLGFMSFFAKAAVAALKKFPVVNASLDGNDVLYHDYFDIGIAVSSPRGLVVPVLRDADSLSFGEIERQIGDFGARARDGKLTMEDLTGGTFSISNGGVFGSMMSTPILNPPQSAILGMHKTYDRPVAENGQVVIRPMMYLALSYDHRLIDGREAVQFLVAIKETLEDPARLLLQV